MAPANDALSILIMSKVLRGVSLIRSTAFFFSLKALFTALTTKDSCLDEATSESVFKEHGTTATASIMNDELAKGEEKSLSFHTFSVFDLINAVN